MSAPFDQRPAPSKAVTALLFVAGTILVLPGICTLAYATVFLAQGELDLKDQIGVMVVIFWGLCLLIALGGVMLLRLARRRWRSGAST
jgi:cytochrome c biogenesis protein CcdA